MTTETSGRSGGRSAASVTAAPRWSPSRACGRTGATPARRPTVLPKPSSASVATGSTGRLPLLPEEIFLEPGRVRRDGLGADRHVPERALQREARRVWCLILDH